MEAEKISRFPKVDYSEGKDSNKSTKNRRTPPAKRRRMSIKEACSDETLKKLKKPLEIGWRRVISWRQRLSKSASRIADIYYYPPENNCGLPSTPTVLEFLQTQNITELTDENFSFSRRILNLSSSNQIERVASIRRQSICPNLKTRSNARLKRIKKVINEVINAITKSAQSLPSRRYVLKAFSDETLNKFIKPLEIGWRRVIAWRQGLSKSGSRISDIYYYPPGSNCALRSMPKILEYLQTQNITKLTDENFSFARRCLNLHSSNQIQRVAPTRRPSICQNLKTQPNARLMQIKKVINEVIDAITKSAHNSHSSTDEMFAAYESRLPILDSFDVQPTKHLNPSILPPIFSSMTMTPSLPIRSKCTLSCYGLEDSDSECEWVLEKKNAANKNDNFDAENRFGVACQGVCKEQESLKNNWEMVNRNFGVGPFIGQIETSLLEPENQFTSVKSMPDVHTCAEKLFFKHLSVIDLLRVMRVCKAWKDMASYPELWKIASLDRCQVVDWSKAILFFHQYQVQTLDLRGVRSTATAFADSLKGMDFLIGFHFGPVAPYVLNYLSDSANISKRMENLWITVIDQRIPFLDDNEVVVDFRMFKQMRQIKNLRIQSALGFVIKADNLPMLRFCHQMRSLSLLDVKDLNDIDFLFLKQMPLLQNLQIGFCTKCTIKTYKLIANLKNLKRLRLECGNSSALFSMLLYLPKLKFLCLTKFTITDLLVDMVASMLLTNLTIWSDFNTPTACETWSVIVNNMEKLKNNLKFLTLGFLGRGVALDRTKQISDCCQTFESSLNRFSVIDKNRRGYLKSIKVDEFVEYAEKFVPYVDLKWSKDEDLAGTRERF